MNNWMDQVRATLECKSNTLSSFQYRHFKIASQIEQLLEKDPKILDLNANSINGFSLLWIYNQIKCGKPLDGNSIAQAEAIVAEKLLNLASIDPISVYASGTVATLTNTPALLNFGTTDPSITLNRAGKYIISARVQYQFVGATAAASKNVISKLRRTNNTAADVSNSSSTIPTGIVTTLTGLLAIVNLPEVVYETQNDNDVISLFGSLSALTDAGSITATEASIIAKRI